MCAPQSAAVAATGALSLVLPPTPNPRLVTGLDETTTVGTTIIWASDGKSSVPHTTFTCATTGKRRTYLTVVSCTCEKERKSTLSGRIASGLRVFVFFFFVVFVVYETIHFFWRAYPYFNRRMCEVFTISTVESGATRPCGIKFWTFN